MNSKYIIAFLLIAFIVSCNSGPKEIAPVNSSNSEYPNQSTGVFDKEQQPDTTKVNSAPIQSELHTVVVKEVLPTDKYVYLYVSENDEEYWIATKKQEVKIGQTYFFRNGLLKTNFESKEYNRVFDKVYLVSNLVAVNHGENEKKPAASQQGNQESANSKSVKTIKPRAGSLSIVEIVKDPEKFEGKTIQVTGECVKVNPNIMGKNWIHLKDGSNDDYDFVVTSDVSVPVGHVISLEGILSLNKDFGSGYKYDILLENATIIR